MSFYAGHSTMGKLQVLNGGLQTRWMLQDMNNAYSQAAVTTQSMTDPTSWSGWSGFTVSM